MAKVTWLGEDENGAAGPSFTTAFDGLKFPKGEAVDVRSYAFVQRALTNQFFEVEDEDDVDDAPGKPPKKRGPGRPSNADKAAEAAQATETQVAAEDAAKPTLTPRPISLDEPTKIDEK